MLQEGSKLGAQLWMALGKVYGGLADRRRVTGKTLQYGLLACSGQTGVNQGGINSFVLSSAQRVSKHSPSL